MSLRERALWIGIAVVMGCRADPTAPVIRESVAVTDVGRSVATNQVSILQIMVALVQKWANAGLLSAGNANALIVKLQSAMAAVERGDVSSRLANSVQVAGVSAKPANSGPLGAFLNQVNAFLASGTLTAAQANQLASLAQSVTSPALFFSHVSVGGFHACGLTPGGLVYCWGDNQFGQLGNGSTTSSTSAVLVSSTETFTTVAAGDNSNCALNASGEAWCWGLNHTGQLGNGTIVNSPIPVAVSGGHTFSSLDAGIHGVCGLEGTAAYCWGAGGRIGVDFGGLGTPAPSVCPGVAFQTPFPCATTPVQVGGGHAFASVAAGLFYGCGQLTNGQSVCWGWNNFWQIGNGTNVNALSPTVISSSLSSIATGAVHTCGLDSSGAAYCWGVRAFDYGAIGDDAIFTGASTPKAVAGGLSFRSIHPAKGNNIFTFTCALTAAGAAWCWGDNSKGELATATPSANCATGSGPIPCEPVPAPVSGGLLFRSLSTGSQFACGVTVANEGYCWGWNLFGQLGNGTATDSPAPVRVIQ